jgi:hypothetical protein
LLSLPYPVKLGNGLFHFESSLSLTKPCESDIFPLTNNAGWLISKKEKYAATSIPKKRYNEEVNAAIGNPLPVVNTALSQEKELRYGQSSRRIAINIQEHGYSVVSQLRHQYEQVTRNNAYAARTGSAA